MQNGLARTPISDGAPFLAETTTKDEELIRRAESARGKLLRDKWRLDQVLGIGGMATVYSATHRNGKRAAVKVLHPEAALAPTVKERFLREGYLANKVDHPGAVSILDDDVDADGTVFLVMELLDGETLDARLSRMGNRLPIPELLQVVDQVTDCLHAAHGKGIVHRDVKPGNLFITRSGTVKILDFGIARLDGVDKPKTGGTGGQTLGTPGFMSPEQARGRWNEVDAQSDLWAVGAVMFASLSGHHVHEAPTVNEQLLAAMTVPARPIRELAPDVPEPVALLVDHALAFSKEGRWPSARAMQEAVRKAYETVVGRPLEQAPRLSIRPPPAASINQNDATIDADAAEAILQRATTARPVTSPLGSPGGRRTIGVVAVAAVAAALGGYALIRGAPTANERVERPSQATAAPATAHAAPAREEPKATAETTPVAALPPAPAPLSSAAAKMNVGEKPRKMPKVPAGSAPSTLPKSPAAAEPAKPQENAVDLFSRRK
jgi:eukaryotic-like serine/threonine-protein kinase